MRFIAPIDTVIYGTDYIAGAEVDTTGWLRAQYLQYLGIGLISPDPMPGESAGAAYTHSQSVSATVWTINHALGFNPNVLTVDSSGTTLWGDIDVVSSSQITATFSAPFSGVAYLS